MAFQIEVLPYTLYISTDDQSDIPAKTLEELAGMEGMALFPNSTVGKFHAFVRLAAGVDMKGAYKRVHGILGDEENCRTIDHFGLTSQ